MMARMSSISIRSGHTASRPVIIWLYALAALVALMILVGGATRLTESGLSITEWQLVTGTVPPLSDEAWADAFEKYKQIPQYQQINRGMSLDQFKTIYWWEWSHRFLGRFIGLAFLLPFLAFWAGGMIERRLAPRLVVIFLLGAAQGALGWFMVMSGLVERTDVSQYRLTAHLGLAFFILGVILWTALREDGVAARDATAGRRSAVLLLALIFVQILLGALVAGLNAGLAYNTWPLMDGRFIPNGLMVLSPWIDNLFENVKTVQFDHRIGAYLVWAVAVVHTIRLSRLRLYGAGGALLLATLVAGQAVLGIWTLLSGVPILLGLAHQAGAILVLAVGVWHVAALSPRAPAESA